MPDTDPFVPRRIAVLGGSGAEGSGLAYRWARAGHEVTLGSRSVETATEAAEKLNALLGKPLVRGDLSTEAVKSAQIVVLAVPYAAQRSTAIALREALVNKILIDVTVPLQPPKVGTVQLPEGGSAVAALQAELGPEVKVVAAFQNVSAHHLKDPDYVIDCDVLVCGDDPEAREAVVQLAHDASLNALHAGPVANAAAVEALTSLLISINRRYKIPSAGIRITGLTPQG